MRGEPLDRDPEQAGVAGELSGDLLAGAWPSQTNTRHGRAWSRGSLIGMASRHDTSAPRAPHGSKLYVYDEYLALLNEGTTEPAG